MSEVIIGPCPQCGDCYTRCICGLPPELPETSKCLPESGNVAAPSALGPHKTIPDKAFDDLVEPKPASAPPPFHETWPDCPTCGKLLTQARDAYDAVVKERDDWKGRFNMMGDQAEFIAQERDKFREQVATLTKERDEWEGHWHSADVRAKGLEKQAHAAWNDTGKMRAELDRVEVERDRYKAILERVHKLALLGTNQISIEVTRIINEALEIK